MARKSSSRGFTVPLMVVGSVMVGLLALIGVKNILQKGSRPAVIASQTIQGNGSVQTIAANNPLPTQDATLPAQAPAQPAASCPLSSNITISPCEVSSITDKVSITFANLPDIQVDPDPKVIFKYFYCLKSSLKDCGEDEWHYMYAPGISNTNTQIEKGQSIFGSLCGDGGKTLKTDCSGTNWFHVGSTYRVFLAQGTSKSTLAKNSSSNIIEVASFYVTHFYPQVIEPINSGIPPNVTPTPIPMPAYNTTAINKNGFLNIDVTLRGRDNSEGVADSYYKNIYYVQVISHDTDYKQPPEGTKNVSCLYIPDPGPDGKRTISLPAKYPDLSGNEIPLSPGSYVLRIKEGVLDLLNKTCSEGKFTFWDIPFSIGGTDDKGRVLPGYMASPVKDPYGKETGPSEFNVKPKPICTQHDNNGYCTSIPTAIGPIHTEPAAFISDIFRIVLSIGGIAAFVLLIQAGYSLMTSAGNKEKVGAAREQITAAIMGLLFIILSITILEFIGINILQIPGFK